MRVHSIVRTFLLVHPLSFAILRPRGVSGVVVRARVLVAVRDT